MAPSKFSNSSFTTVKTSAASAATFAASVLRFAISILMAAPAKAISLFEVAPVLVPGDGVGLSVGVLLGVGVGVVPAIEQSCPGITQLSFLGSTLWAKNPAL